MKDWAQMVAEFNLKNGYRSPDYPTPSVSDTIKMLRMRLMMEELGELAIAMHENNIIKVADGICDLMYVVLGTANEYGLTAILDELFQEVHRSNMTKEGHGIADGRKGGKKGINFQPPDLGTIIIREQMK